MAFGGILLFLLLFFALGIGVFLLSLAMWLIARSKYKKYYGLQKQMEAAVPTVGVIMDCRQLHGSGTASKNGKVKAYKKGAYPFLYEFSVAYRCEDGMQHISFFGVRAKEPLPYSIADSVSMWRFPQPLAPVPQWIFDEGRSVDGRLPQQVFHHAWYGVPVDETATVILEIHREAVLKTFRRRRRIAFGFYAAAMVPLIICVVLAAAFWLA